MFHSAIIAESVALILLGSLSCQMKETCTQGSQTEIWVGVTGKNEKGFVIISVLGSKLKLNLPLESPVISSNRFVQPCSLLIYTGVLY